MASKHELNGNGHHAFAQLTNDELESKLALLAGKWRRYKRNEIVSEYQNILRSLLARGWDDYLDLDSELPTEHMPVEYYKRTDTITNP